MRGFFFRIWPTFRDQVGPVASRGEEDAFAEQAEFGVAVYLLDWSTRHDHLREVTRQDILTSTHSLPGSKRHHTLSVLRSLFRHCKKTATIFRDPAARIRVGRHD